LSLPITMRIRRARHITCLGTGGGVERRWTTFGAARRFEESAREAESKHNYGLAAALYRAALLVLKGESLDDSHVLADAGCVASAYGDPPRWGALPQEEAAAETSDPRVDKP
jgi:hypothetical protein